MVSFLKEQLTLEKISVPGFYKIIKVSNPSARLTAIIAFHDLRLGRAALGGTRIYPYKTFEEALVDATRLARGMTYKSAASLSGWGGAKSVIIADPAKDKNEQLLSAFGEAVHALEGEYICAEDSGCSPQDMTVIAEQTPFVVGLPHAKSSGNPSPFTAWGVYRGIQAALHQIFGSPSVEGKTIAIQGVGSVGAQLAELLFWHGAELILTDVNVEKAKMLAKQYGATFVAPEAIFDQKCDVFSPCAMGGIINSQTIKRLRCRGIAGAANNQLLTDADAQTLHSMGILYAPDFVINSGGLINVTEETFELGYNSSIARNKIDKIYDQLKLIFEISANNNISTLQAVMRLVEYRLQYGVGRRLDPIYMHHAGMSY